MIKEILLHPKFKFKTEHEFNNLFKTELERYQFLEEIRWNNKPTCPHCKGANRPKDAPSRSRLAELKIVPSYRCSNSRCNRRFTVKTGTAFQGSKLTLYNWFKAIYEIAISKNSNSAQLLARRLNLPGKTAWLLFHKIRHILAIDDCSLKGLIEADDAYSGGNDKNRHYDKKKYPKGGRSLADKVALLGMFQRGGDAVLITVPDVTTETLTEQLKKYVHPNSTVITDGFSSYNKIGEFFKRHISVKHEKTPPTNGKKYAKPNYITKGYKHTNNIEGIWSFLKFRLRTLRKLPSKHIQPYCDEAAFMFNQRNNSPHGIVMAIFERLEKKPITYKKLTAKKPTPLQNQDLGQQGKITLWR